MPQVKMPDGQIVDMPDTLDPQLGARLRSFQTAEAAKAAGPATVGNTLGGAAELAGTGIGNIPHAALHAGVDLIRRLTGGDTDAPDPGFVQATQVAPGQAAQNLMARVEGARGPHELADKLGTPAPELSNPTLQDIRQQANSVGSDVMGLAPAAGIVKGVAGAVANAGAAGEAAAASAPSWAKAGFRTAADSPIARNVAGTSGKDALNLHNQPIGNVLASAESGVPHGTPLTYEALEAARAAPNSVYGRVAQNLPEGPLSPSAQTMIQNAGSSGRITTGTPAAATAIDKLKTELTDPNGKFSGDRVVNELRGLRQEGYTNVGSEDVSNQQLGKAQLDMAKGLEQHITDTLPANGTVSTQQLQEARTALAKNHAVQSSLRGNDIDMQALARVQRADPKLLTGGLQDIADFANLHPEVSTLPAAGARYNPPGLLKDVGSINPLERPIQSIAQVLGGGLARRALTGNTAAAIEAAQARFPGASAGKFAPVEPKPPSAGNLALAPEPPIQSPPSNPGPGAAGGFSLADLLSTGVEQPPARGLSLADATAPQQGGIPFQQNADHLAGGLSLAPNAPAVAGAPATDLASVLSAHIPNQVSGIERPYPRAQPTPGAGAVNLPAKPGLSSLADELTLAPDEPLTPQQRYGNLGDVMSQGVPEGILQRTPGAVDTGPGLPPPGKKFGGVLYRGTPKGADTQAANKIGARFLTPNVVPEEGGTAAQDYATGGGQVTAHKVRMSNMLDAKSPGDAAKALNLPAGADMMTIAKAATKAGYDGLHYLVGKAHEYVQLGLPTVGAAAEGAPDIPF